MVTLSIISATSDIVSRDHPLDSVKDTVQDGTGTTLCVVNHLTSPKRVMHDQDYCSASTYKKILWDGAWNASKTSKSLII